MVMLHRTLLALAGDLRGPLGRSITVGFALFGARVLQALLVGLVIGVVLDGRDLPSTIAVIAALFAVLVARAGLVWARERTAQSSAESVKARLRGRLLAHLFVIGPGALESTRSGEVATTLVDGVEGLEAYYARYLPQLVVALVGPALIVCWLLLTAPAVGAAVGLGAIAVPLLPRLWDRLLAERGREHWDAYSRLGADYQDAMQGMTTLKALDAAAAKGRELRDRADHLAHSTMRQMGVSLVDTGLTSLGSQLGIALAVAIGAVGVATGELSVAALSVILVLTAECFRPFAELSAQWHAGFLGISAADGITRLLATEPVSPDPPGTPALRLDHGPPAIVFERVTLTYPGRTDAALRDLELCVPAGAMVGIVGRSGAGKSSLIAALTRMRPLDSGRILVAGTDIASVSAGTVRAAVAVVSQEAHLFHGTVADNLRLAAPDAEDAALWRALADADAATFVRDLPEQLQTVLGDRGATISGGQRQRLAIARAFLLDAPVLVLDEPTSAVDAASELRIIEAIRRRAAGRTTLLIAHRLSTVRTADLIAVVKDGRLVEQGTHDELLARSGTYAALVAAQLMPAGLTS